MELDSPDKEEILEKNDAAYREQVQSIVNINSFLDQVIGLNYRVKFLVRTLRRMLRDETKAGLPVLNAHFEVYDEWYRRLHSDNSRNKDPFEHCAYI